MQESLLGGYKVLIALEAVAEILRSTAQDIQEERIDGFEGLGALLTAAVFAQATGEALDTPAPHPALEGSWEEARLVLPMLRSVIAEWGDSDITSADVPARLEPIDDRLDAMWDASDEQVAALMAIDTTEVESLREEVREQLREALRSTPTPHPAADALVAPSYRVYTEGDWMYVVGEVVNESSEPMGFLKVVVTFYDDSGSVVATDYTYTDLDVIPPGGKSPFTVITDALAVGDHKLQIQGSPADLPRQDLVIASHSLRTEGDWTYIVGEIQNTGTSPAEFVKLVATFYDASGDVVGADYTYSELDVIAAGDTSPFELMVSTPLDLDHYEIQVQGR